MFVGLPEMGVKVPNGKLNFAEDAMVQNVDKINTERTAAASSTDD
jgi:hypothetical protein